MRAVFDTNVIISGLLWNGAVATLLEYVESKKVTLCLTPCILNEIERVLNYPKFSKQLFIVGFSTGEILSFLSKQSLLFEDIDLVAPITEDESDNMFINCALASRSKWIV